MNADIDKKMTIPVLFCQYRHSIHVPCDLLWQCGSTVQFIVTEVQSRLSLDNFPCDPR